MSIAEESIVTDAVEAARQYVQQEAPHELVGLERHGLVARAALLAVILAAEGDAALIVGDQAAVGDGDPVGVAGKIAEDCGGSCEGALGVDDPFDFAEWKEPLAEARGIGELGMLAKETEFAATMKLVCSGMWPSPETSVSSSRR